MSRAARALGITVQSLYRRLDEQDILYSKKVTREMFQEHYKKAQGDLALMARNLRISLHALRIRKTELEL